MMEDFPLRKRESKTDRFYCPYPGCKRSFLDLWRLKVHYRADSSVRGSGRERGHGRELPACPKCKKQLERGRHHVNCAAGKAAPSQAHRRLQRATRDRAEGSRSTLENINYLGSRNTDVEAAWNIVLPQEMFNPAANFGPMGSIGLSEQLRHTPNGTNQMESDVESLTAFSFQTGNSLSMSGVSGIQVRPGYAIFLRPNATEKPKIYFLPGETMEVSVAEPMLGANHSIS